MNMKSTKFIIEKTEGNLFLSFLFVLFIMSEEIYYVMIVQNNIL